MQKGKLFICFLILFVFSVSLFGLDQFYVKYVNDVESLSAVEVRSIIDTALEDRLATGAYFKATTRVYSGASGRALSVVAYLFRNDSFLLECYRIDLDNAGQVTKVIDDYTEPVAKADVEPCGTCPDESVEVYAETALDYFPAAYQAVNWGASVTRGAGYKTVEAYGLAATSQNFKNYMSCPKLKLIIRVGHGNKNVIAFNGDDTIYNPYFEALPSDYLDGQVHMYGSCLVHNVPLQPAVIGAGVRAYMGGITTLSINDLPMVMYAMLQSICYGGEIKAAFNASGAPGYGWGLSGNPSGGPWYLDPPGPPVSPTATPITTPTPTPTATATPTATPVIVNAALTATVTASSFYTDTYHYRYVNDGDESTVWGGNAGDTNPYAILELDRAYSIKRIVVKWYNPYYASSYYIGTKSGTDWDAIKITGDGDTDIYEFTTPVNSQTVGLQSLTGPMGLYGIKEIEVWGF